MFHGTKRFVCATDPVLRGAADRAASHCPALLERAARAVPDRHQVCAGDLGGEAGAPYDGGLAQPRRPRAELPPCHVPTATSAVRNSRPCPSAPTAAEAGAALYRRRPLAGEGAAITPAHFRPDCACLGCPGPSIQVPLSREALNKPSPHSANVLCPFLAVRFTRIHITLGPADQTPSGERRQSG